jgi:hypothetical protein
MADPRSRSDQRPSPEALLEAARQEESRAGRLKIFVGAAPGVGKTYEMLQQARARKQDGYAAGVDGMLLFTLISPSASASQSVLSKMWVSVPQAWAKLTGRVPAVREGVGVDGEQVHQVSLRAVSAPPPPDIVSPPSPPSSLSLPLPPFSVSLTDRAHRSRLRHLGNLRRSCPGECHGPRNRSDHCRNRRPTGRG